MSSANRSSVTHLFVDGSMIARKEGVVRRTHPCRKLPQPVISGLESWQAPSDDERVYIYGTVLPAEEGDGLRMWYMRDPDRVLYAESEDGVTWHRPELGLVENDGSTRNNALPIRLHSPSVIHDPTDSDSGRRYKMLGVSHSPESRGYCTAHSADGLNWQLYDMPRKKITIARASWRLDGWVSLDAVETPGTVETTPMPSDSQRLIVNADAARGELRAEVLDPSGAPVPGHRLSDCRPVTEDGVRQTVHWKTRSALPSCRAIRIRFQLSNASLYSFSIV